MRLVEIRELDGPNLFLPEPAIKIEIAFESEADLAWTRERAKARLNVAASSQLSDEAGIADVLRAAVAHLVTMIGQPVPASTLKTLDTRGHLAFAFGWSRRDVATYVSEMLVDLLSGDREEPWPMRPFEPGDESGPLWVRDGERRAKIVAITGTNGKTTTTRLVAHMVMQAGMHAGWSSSSGVYIDGDEVLTGDYSGPSGARRVLEEQSVDVAVLETARGGVLLRGLAFESSDVSVFINVSGDHLGLQGINTVESLAAVKATVPKSTRPDGVAVLNADDKQVMKATSQLRAAKLLVSQNPENQVVVDHVLQAGRALVLSGGEVVYCQDGAREPLLRVEEIPIAYGGRAAHMVENALCAAGAGIGLGLDLREVADGLRSFRNSPEQNLGRLNLFSVNGVTVVLDYAHNPAGLTHLLAFACSVAKSDGRVISIIGTAGDREAEALREIGRIAGAESGLVIVKNTAHYLRGRTAEEMFDLFEQGVRANPSAAEPIRADSERAGLELALERAQPGDAIAIMCQEQMAEIVERLNELGHPI
jgi:cyanophycin synthetase